MNDLWTSAGVWMLRTALGGGLLLLVTCVLMRWTPHPARRQRLGDWGMSAALLAALGSAIGPSWLVIAWTQKDTATKTAPLLPQHSVVEYTWHVAGAAEPEGPAALSFLAAASPLGLGEDESPPDIHRGLAAESASRIDQAGALAVLAGLVIAGLFAIRLLGGYVALLRLLWRSEAAPPDVRGLFETMAAGTRWVRLLVSRRLVVPLSCGLVRPTVVLPASMCQPPTPRQLRWIFAHELMHLRRRDAWSGLLFNLGQVFFFALPWFWWLRRQVRLCQEYVADAAAAGQDEGSVEYAEFLVSLANAPAVPVGASAVSGNCSDLSRRVTMLLNDPVRVETRCPRLWTMLVAGGLASLAVLVSGFGYRAEASADDTIIIIIQPQSAAGKAQTEKPKGVFFYTVPAEQKKAEEKKVEEKKVKMKVIIDPEKGGDVKEVRKQFIILDKDGLKGGKLALWLTEQDDLGILQNVLTQLEALKRDGKLTNERIEAEVLKALRQMKANLKVVPVEGGKDKKSTQNGDNKVQIELVIPKSNQAESPWKLRVKELPILPVQRYETVPTTKYWQVPKEVQNKVELESSFNPVIPPDKVRVRTFLSAQKPLLGVSIEPISPAIAEHLNLPSKVGLLVTAVVPDSPAAKGGIKANDVLVKIDGAMVPGQPEEFHQLVASLKAGTPLEVVVLRKGKTLNVGSITLAGESPKSATDSVPRPLQAEHAAQRAQNIRAMQALLVEKNAATTTVERKGDTLTITHKESGATFSVTGVLKEGKLEIGNIEVNDGKTTQKYDSLPAVPESQRARVERLVEAVGRLEVGPAKEQ